MWYLVGLGNPGKEYQNSRHNAGWITVNALQQHLGLPAFSTHKKSFSELSRGQAITLVKPQTYMNDSGRAVRGVLEYFQSSTNLEEVIKNKIMVIHDDLDLELGVFKIAYGKGPKVHNGLLSLYAHLQTDQFWHVRIGVDARQGNRTMPGSQYVLQPFSDAEFKILTEVITQVSAEILKKMGVS